jgi:hypothetical protein
VRGGRPGAFGLPDALALAVAIAGAAFVGVGCDRTAQSTSARPASADAAVAAVTLDATTPDDLASRFGPPDAHDADGSPIYRFDAARRGESVTFRFANGVLTKVCRSRS